MSLSPTGETLRAGWSWQELAEHAASGRFLGTRTSEIRPFAVYTLPECATILKLPPRMAKRLVRSGQMRALGDGDIRNTRVLGLNLQATLEELSRRAEAA